MATLKPLPSIARSRTSLVTSIVLHTNRDGR
jgi:hypothetical protein